MCRLPSMVGKIGCPFALQYTSIAINIAIQHTELNMGTTQNDATNMMTDVRLFARKRLDSDLSLCHKSCPIYRWSRVCVVLKTTLKDKELRFRCDTRVTSK
jgi:hypothetical protein